MYFRGSTCAQVKDAGTATGTDVGACTDFSTLAGQPTQPSPANIAQLIQGAASSGSLISMSLSSGAPGQPAMVVFVHVLDTGIPAYVARLSANGVTLEIASLPSPTIATNTGAFFCENAVKAGEVALLPFQDPPPNPIPTTSDFTLIYASVSSNLTVIESEQVSVNVSALTFTVVPPDKTWDGGGTNGGANFFL